MLTPSVKELKYYLHHSFELLKSITIIHFNLEFTTFEEFSAPSFTHLSYFAGPAIQGVQFLRFSFLHIFLSSGNLKQLCYHSFTLARDIIIFHHVSISNEQEGTRFYNETLKNNLLENLRFMPVNTFLATGLSRFSYISRRGGGWGGAERDKWHEIA